jgi:hypothetical protein
VDDHDPELDAEITEQLEEAFTPAQRRALEVVWAVNARTLAQTHILTIGMRRMLVRGLAAIFVVMLAIGGWNFVLQVAEKRNAQHTAKVALAQAKAAQATARQFALAVQTSRYDGALLACQNTNGRHDNALQYVDALDKTAPAAGILATNLLDVLAPLRDGQNGRETCTQYAHMETALDLSVVAPAPGAEGCSPANETMGCVLGGLPAAPLTYGISPAVRLGVDFGWGSVTPAQAKELHVAFIASYLSDDPSKDLTAATVQAFHAEGVETVNVWESTATRSTEGRAAGITDALTAAAQARALGNTTRPILFAIDCDCTDAQILAYFQGVHSVLGARTDAYGGYAQVAYLHSVGLVGSENWQTYAWSEGHWLPGTVAPLEQYLNGTSYDWDRAIAVPYGEFPWTATKPKPRPVVTHTTTTPAPPPVPHPRRGTVCWGTGATPASSSCRQIIARHTWLVDRRIFWGREFGRCIRYADGIGCARAERWYVLRRDQATDLRRRYSR